jgi:hypothetical protein
MNQAALRYVDVGGQRDQSIYLSGRLEYELDIPANGFKELNFFVASPGASVPLPERTAWTVASLRKAARGGVVGWRGQRTVSFSAAVVWHAVNSCIPVSASARGNRDAF